ncbi:MAG: serine hydroxymethyltransferase [Desulfosarcina sp.]|nr:serine hydroxymethyltransferase [Desulfosarcina sp.]MBC2765656.1 serine hydroxymethyltransferase [Desulfosarcina sp.]
MDHLCYRDPEIYKIVEAEKERIENTLDLIAAENHASLSILEAQGSAFNMKAAEGYPGRRFHAGCDRADDLETLAIQRGKKLFGAEHLNVQPHSGTSANLAAYFSVLKPGDRILAMKLSHGGHLSHGDTASITSQCFQFSHYGLDPDTEQLDYDAIIPSPVPVSDFVTFTTYKTLMGGRGGVIISKEKYRRHIDRAVFPGSQGTPALNQVAAKAVCFHLADTPEFITVQKRIVDNAAAMADEFKKRDYRLVSGGTDNHMVLVDLRSKALIGRDAEKMLESTGIIVNRNVIPNDPQSPDQASGIRVGASAISARGIETAEARHIVGLIDAVMSSCGRREILDHVASEVASICRDYPVYPE